MRPPAQNRAIPPPLYVESYLQRYRAQIPVRRVQVGLAAAATGVFWSPTEAVQFAVVHFALYAMLMRVVRRGFSALDRPDTYRKLQLTTGVLAFFIGVHICTLALMLSTAEHGRLHEASLLLAIALLVLAGLQVHMSRVGFLIGVLPQTSTLLFMTVMTGKPVDPVALFSIPMFICCIVAAAWRQQTTDRQATVLRVEQASHNEQLRAALDQCESERVRAEEASRAKSHVLAVASHEIRTPLNVVLGLTEGLRREALSARQKSHIEGIHQAGAVLLRLLNAVLDVAKAEAGSEKVRLESMAPAALLADIVSVWGPSAAEAGLELSLDIQDEARRLTVLSDFTKVEQTIVNLVSNAIKLSAPGRIGLGLRVLPGAREAEATLRFEVADRGPGVKPEDRERIFNVFEQTAAGVEKGGAGLGLAICRSNVELLGGRIGVDSRAGGGSVFWFEIPAALAEAPAQSEDPQAAPPRERALQILVAEDNAANRHVLSLLLEPTGCDITFAENGSEAVEAATSRSFDLIFMDAMMPVMDGATAVAHIRRVEGPVRTPIVMLTANVFEDDIRTYWAAGADDVLKKPIEVRELYRCLDVGALAGAPGPDRTAPRLAC